ncbi:down syndrome cell adhesion molecule-like protein Dscam2 [Caerostris extrusa]|uniref:Down syndrome cell adhesion molecule-like protein Dscam2 n=1 Tax=Caerostris extrusa TaxID=172846 RepID=A0AAV4Q9R1_CAEEX|nr:down syndrome cell adhesion molecule-like protein Dscam2 [Caerostris extrusa]
MERGRGLTRNDLRTTMTLYPFGLGREVIAGNSSHRTRAQCQFSKEEASQLIAQTEGFPQPRVRWTKSEGDSPRDYKSIVSSPHLQVFENGSLAITDATESDAGYYLCQASNGIGQGLSKVVRLKVYSKLKLICISN